MEGFDVDWSNFGRVATEVDISAGKQSFKE
jgi:hypothetical protein